MTDVFTEKEFAHKDRIYIVPKHWSDNASRIFVAKYCRSYGDKFAEHSVREVFNRLVNFWASVLPDVDREEIHYDLWNQIASPNSPQYFNAGIYKSYGVFGDNIGLWYITKEGKVVGNWTTYAKPQLHACFIQPVSDSLGSIFDLAKKEAMLFSRGSGTGTNFSTLRGRGEKIKGGGASSGLISFLEIYDSIAGAIKSGGTTRRAAKMVVLDIDHPDIEEFIDWKFKEEKKAKALIEQGYDDSWEGDAYQTVSGQNSNNSISVSDEFMNAVHNKDVWSLVGRVDKSVNKVVRADKLWWKICEAAWHCADPGLQFSTTINEWNTTPVSGRIRASNPCSEHLRLDNSACNLASINLDSVFNCHGYFAFGRFEEICRRWTRILDACIDLAGYPSKEIGENAYSFRDIGLGFANLGGVLLRAFIPYDSEEGRNVAAVVASQMTASAYLESMEIAKEKQPYPSYDKNKICHQEIVARHLLRSKILAKKIAEEPVGNIKNLMAAAENALQKWQQVYDDSAKHGFRNAQLTVLAPTGTIAITMDCETTGIEPVFSTHTTKVLAGGGELKQTIPSIEKVVEEFGKEKRNYRLADVIATAVSSDESYKVLSPEAHVDMVSVVQPFISGGISKTVNLPSSATIDDINRIYNRAWDGSLKCISVYRDKSKSQPLNPAECKSCGDESVTCEIKA